MKYMCPNPLVTQASTTFNQNPNHKFNPYYTSLINHKIIYAKTIPFSLSLIGFDYVLNLFIAKTGIFDVPISESIKYVLKESPSPYNYKETLTDFFTKSFKIDTK